MGVDMGVLVLAVDCKKLFHITNLIRVKKNIKVRIRCTLAQEVVISVVVKVNFDKAIV